MTGRRTTLIAGALVAGVAITTFALASGGGPATAARQTASATAAVVRTTLASRQQVAGTLERAGSYTLVSQSAGTLTRLPAPGAVIRRGQVLYRLDGQPVRLFYGTQTAWRTLEPAMTDGADVLQLKRNLRALGFTAYGTLRVSDDFDWATAVAVGEWQQAHGLTPTGVLPLGTIAFLPGAVRVTAQLSLPGTPALPGTQLLGLSSTELAVSVPLDPSLRQLVHVGDRVQIQLPEGQTTPGRVSQIGAATAAPSSSGSPSAGGGSAAQAASSSTAQQGGGGSATVPVMVSLDRPRAARGLDQVPVQVAITDTVHRHVLAVPVTALLALAGGGYAVAVDASGRRTLIAVKPGIFDGNLVEVSSSRLRAGMRVEVASS